MISQLTKIRTKELEQISVPMIHVLMGCSTDDANKWFKVLCWTHANKLTNASLKNTVAKMSELMGFRQNYHVNYEYRNAVWGLEWNGIEFLIYVSNGGLAVQLLPEVTQADGIALVWMLYEVLIANTEHEDLDELFDGV